MSTPVRSLLELAELVTPALKARLVERPGWLLEPVQVSGRALVYAVRRGDVTVQLLVESAANPGPAAVTGRALRVLAPGATPDSRLFDELARAVAALEVELSLPETAQADAPAHEDEKEDVLQGGLLYNPSRHERRFHLISVGMPRTGSTSIAAMFGAWRSAHEYWCTPMADVLSKRHASLKSADDVKIVLARREAAGKLEVDSATFLHLAIEELVQMHPTAAYVLTWRPFESWFDSYLGLLERQARERASSEPWPTWEQQMATLILGDFDPRWFASPAALSPALPKVAAAALKFWREGLERCLSSLPKTALVLSTSQLSKSGPALARLVGVPASELQPKHLNVGEASRQRWSVGLPVELKARAAEQVAPLLTRLAAARGTLPAS